MISQSLKSFLNTREQFKERFTVSRDLPRFFCQTLTQVMDPLQHVVLSKTLITQCFSYNLQVSHSRHAHVRETAGGSKDLFENRNRVLLICPRAHGTD